jgi:hypothetical protein
MGGDLSGRVLRGVMLDSIADRLVVRTEATMTRPASLLALTAALLAAISLVGLGYVEAELAGGLPEVPHHWWSTLPLLGLLVSAATALAAHRLSKT